MRKLLTLFMLAAVLTLPFSALAAPEATPEEPPAAETQERESEIRTGLQIDNAHCYDGMDRPYSEGYMPSVQDGTARIVLPLLAPEDGPAQVRVRVDLGDPAAAPFVFDNYDRTLLPEEHETSDGLEERVFLMDLSVPLVEAPAPGRYPVSFLCESDAAAGAQLFTVYVTLEGEPALPSDEPEPDPGEGAPGDIGGGDYYGGDTGSSGGSAAGSAPSAEPTPALQPKLMVTGYSVSASPAVAGEPFTVTFTLQNTSETQQVRNLLVQADSDDSNVAAAGGANSFYFKQLAPQETTEISVQMLAASTVEAGIKKIQVHAGYDDPEGKSYESEDSLPIQVSQPVRFVVDEPDIPQEVHAGETMNLSLSVMNMGRSPVLNVLADLEAPGLTAQNSLFLGNIESGTSKQGIMYVFVGALPDEGGASRYAFTEGTLTVTCEDEFGGTYEETHAFSLSIEPPVISAAQEPEEEPEEQNQWLPSALIGGAILVAVIAVWLILRARKRRAEETEDEDI